MADIFPMIIHTFTPSEDYNGGLKRLDTKLNASINQNSIKVPKVVNE